MKSMGYNPEIHHRRSIRLKGYDYTQAGAYFVTMVTMNRESLFGTVLDGGLQLNAAGRIVETCWQSLERHFVIELGQWIIMPNHLHGIIFLGAGEEFAASDSGLIKGLLANEGEAFADIGSGLYKGSQANEGEAFAASDSGLFKGLLANASPQRRRPIGTRPDSLGAIIQNFKSVSTRKINQERQSPSAPVWQRNYFERIIRDESELNRIQQYILDNPARRAEDQDL